MGDPRAAIAHNPIPSKHVFLEPAAPAFYSIQKSHSLSASHVPGDGAFMPTARLRPAFLRKLGLEPVDIVSREDIWR